MLGSYSSSSRGWIAAVTAALCALSLLAALAGAESASAQADPPACLDDRSDQFDGTALDEERWSRIVREAPTGYSVGDGALSIETGAGEIQGGDPGEAPNLITQPAPEGSWTARTKVSITHTAGAAGEGQQAGLLVTSADAQDFVKIAFVNKGAGGRWIEALRGEGGNLQLVGTWNTGLAADYPDELWLRARVTGDTLRADWSPDGVNWRSGTPTDTTPNDPPLTPLDIGHIEDPSVGVYALRGPAARPAVTAEFDRFDLIAADDEFDGDALDRCRWEVQNEDASGLAVGDGQLTLKTLRGELSNNQSTVKNLLLQPAGGDQWQATTKLSIAQTHAGQQAGLVVRGVNDSNHSKIVLVRKEDGGRWIEFLRTTNGATDFNGTWNTGYQDFPASVWVRLVSDGSQLSGFWSADGETWTKVGDSRSLAGIEAPRVGPMALSGENDNPPVDAKFDFFHLEPYDAPPPQAPDCLTQSEPETDFSTIFDGTQAQFDAWRHAGEGSFTLADGAMTSTNTAESPGLGLHWFPGESYKNFTVRMQWRVSDATDNSGVFVRFPDPGNDPGVAIERGHEIQIYDGETGEPQKTGSIYNADREDFRNSKPPGEWNDYQITVNGQRYTVCLNGKIVNQYTSNQGRGSEGFIGVQNHDPNSVVSFRNIRVKELPDVPPVQDVFDTIGITTVETRNNGQIHGTPQRYSYIAESMPRSRSVGVPGDDTFDEVPVRMPDTTGTVPNLASFNGQEYVFPQALQKPYSRLHFYGTTTDAAGGPSGGDFTLVFADGTTETMTVRFRDWVSTGGSADDHIAITSAGRYTQTGRQDTPFHIFHRPVAVSEANRGKAVASIRFPTGSTPGNANTRAYLMALTLEDAQGGFDSPILAGSSEFPNDQTPPVTEATADPGEPTGENGWYTGPVTVTLESADEEGGSQVDVVEYRVDGGAWNVYSQPFSVDSDGAHDVQYRAIDRAGNLETQQTLEVNIDATAPSVEHELAPNLPAGAEWYDRAVTMTLDGFDGRGSGVDSLEVSVNDGPFQAYDVPITFSQDGTYVVEYRATDQAGNESASVDPVTVKVDAAAPTTTARLNGAAPAATYAGGVNVALTGADAGSGVQLTEYRLDGGGWTVYSAPFAVAGAGVHTVSFRSVDTAGNEERVSQIAFNITVAGSPPPPINQNPPGSEPAPEPEPWVALLKPRRRTATVRNLGARKLRVTVRCQSVDRASLRVLVSRRAARRLGLRNRVLASRAVRCDGAARKTVTIKPGKRVRRALAKRRSALWITVQVRGAGEAGRASDAVRVKLRGRR